MSLPLAARFCANTRSNSACERKLAFNLHLDETDAPLLAAACEHFAPPFGFHARAETEFADAFEF